MQPKRDFGSEIRKLPKGKPLTRRQLLRPAFRLESSGQIRIYYAPVDYVNRKAKIVLAGITPGWTQMELIYRTAVEHWDTLSPRAISRKVKQAGAFAGSMRNLLVNQLDGIGVDRFLSVESTSALFDSASHLLHATSVLRYPVFVDGENYTGHKPALLRTPLFAPYIDDFAREVERVEQALIVPLGKAVSGVLEYLVAEERIDKRRCLIGFPHPSGANALRARHFAERRRSLRRRVKRWADTGT